MWDASSRIIIFQGQTMGAEQPKKVARVTKAQIDIGTLKARIHLELFRDRKNAEIIKGEKELIAKIKSKSRNKTEELLIAERVVNGLKQAQACNLLIGYAASLRGQAHFISENMLIPQKMEPWLPMIYSLIYAADHLGLSSLTEFKALMRALNDPVALERYVNPDIIAALTPCPSPEEINTYALQMCERNQVPLEELNVIGHKFTREWKNIPSVPPSVPSSGPSVPPGDNSFDDLARQLDAEIKGKNNPNGPGGNPYGNGGNPYGGNQGGNPNGNQGYNPNQGYAPNQGYVPNQYNPNQFNPNSPNQYNPSYNPYKQMDINQLLGPTNPSNNNPNAYIGGNAPNNGFSGNTTPANLGPNFYVPADITPVAKPVNPPRSSINSINDIDYYPEIDSEAPLFNKGGYSDPSFDQLCERLKKGL